MSQPGKQDFLPVPTSVSTPGWLKHISANSGLGVSSIMQGHLRPHCVVPPALNTPEFNTEIILVSLACETS